MAAASCASEISAASSARPIRSGWPSAACADQGSLADQAGEIGDRRSERHACPGAKPPADAASDALPARQFQRHDLVPPQPPPAVEDRAE